MESILVTGASGFIGTNLCRYLVDEGYSVQGLDIKRPRFEHPPSVELHRIDLTESSDLPEADIIVHLAAHSQVQPVVDNPNRAVENIAMTQNVLEAAAGMDAFLINASSRDVYGSSLTPSEHDVTPNSPNGYAASKLGSEALVNSYRRTKDISAVSIRLSNVYGPMDDNPRVIPLFIALADAGEELTVFGDGTLIDFVHIDDVCEAIITSVYRSSVVDGEVINVGSGVGTALIEVANTVADIIEESPGWTVSENRDGDVSKYVSDISKAESLLKYHPSVSFELGIKNVIEWYQNHPQVLKNLIADHK